MSFSDTMELDVAEVTQTCSRLLKTFGTPDDIALVVTEDLLQSELEGYPSHGLMRIIEYCEGIESGKIIPDKRPTAQKINRNVRVVDGNRGFGVIALEKIYTELKEVLDEGEPIGVAGLINCNHIGRLAHVIEPLANKYVVIAFVNYQGAGQNVAPWGGAEGRFCTNPIGFGFPAKDHNPIIIDMTTSIVSEGEIRNYFLSNQLVPDGYLLDEKWEYVNDPREFYKEKRTALIAPLGGDKGYKGYALGLAVEILSGIITGAGFASPKPSPGGNGGFFISINPTVFGRSMDQVYSETDQLISYLRSTKPAAGFKRVRIPGESIQKRKMEKVLVDPLVWKKIINLLEQRSG